MSAGSGWLVGWLGRVCLTVIASHGKAVITVEMGSAGAAGAHGTLLPGRCITLHVAAHRAGGISQPAQLAQRGDKGSSWLCHRLDHCWMRQSLGTHQHWGSRVGYPWPGLAHCCKQLCGATAYCMGLSQKHHCCLSAWGWLFGHGGHGRCCLPPLSISVPFPFNIFPWKAAFPRNGLIRDSASVTS